MPQLRFGTTDAKQTRRSPFPSTTNQQGTMKNGNHAVASQHGSEKRLIPSAEWGRSSLVLLFGILMLLSPDTKAQQIGVDICACQPSVYEFTFDFLNNCTDFNVTGPGITDTSCLVNFEVDTNTTGADLRPVIVTKIDVLELDQMLQVVAQTQITAVDGFQSGETL
jgi:hypothetical protein